MFKILVLLFVISYCNTAPADEQLCDGVACTNQSNEMIVLTEDNDIINKRQRPGTRSPVINKRQRPGTRPSFFKNVNKRQRPATRPPY